MATWFKRAMSTPETRFAAGALIPIGFFLVLAILISASPRVALHMLNFGTREVRIGSGDPVPMPGDFAEGLLTGLPISSLKSPKALPTLLNGVEDRSLKIRTRVQCAELAIRPALNEEQIGRLKRALLDMGEERFSTHGMPIFTVLMGGTFSGDKEVRAFLVEAANRDPIYSGYLARQNFPEAIPAIEKNLREGKWKGYAALGAFNTPESFNALERLLPGATESRWKFVILAAMGGTKDPRARPVLLNHLTSKDYEIHSGALRGLAHLGDPTTIPILQKEMRAGHTGREIAKIQRTIEHIKAGGQPYRY